MDRGPEPEAAQLFERLDGAALTRLHVFTLALCAGALAFDLMEVAFGSALAAVFSAPPHSLPTTELSWLLSSVFIGAVCGAPLMGMLADKIGRRTTLVLLLLLLGALSGLAALSRTPLELTVWRGLSGLSLGAFPPLMVVYLTDLLPSRRRGPVILLVSGFAFLGAPAGIFLIRALTPVEPFGLEAWRWAFWTGTTGSVALALLMQRWLPESPRWLATNGRLADAKLVVERYLSSRPVLPALPPLSNVVTGKQEVDLAGLRGFWLLASLYFLAAWSTVGFSVVSGAVLIQKGVRLSDTLLYVGLSTFGPLLGSLLASTVADRIERRTLLALCAAVMMAGSYVFIQGDSGWLLATSSLLVALCSAIYVPMLNLYGAESASGARRSGAVGSAWAFNRLGAAMSPLLLVPLLKQSGAWTMYAVIAASLVLTLAMLAAAPKGRAQRAVG